MLEKLDGNYFLKISNLFYVMVLQLLFLKYYIIDWLNQLLTRSVD